MGAGRARKWLRVVLWPTAVAKKAAEKVEISQKLDLCILIISGPWGGFQSLEGKCWTVGWGYSKRYSFRIRNLTNDLKSRVERTWSMSIVGCGEGKNLESTRSPRTTAP